MRIRRPEGDRLAAPGVLAENVRLRQPMRAYQRASRGAQTAIEVGIRGIGGAAVNTALPLLPLKEAIPVGVGAALAGASDTTRPWLVRGGRPLGSGEQLAHLGDLGMGGPPLC